MLSPISPPQVQRRAGAAQLASLAALCIHPLPRQTSTHAPRRGCGLRSRSSCSAIARGPSTRYTRHRLALPAACGSAARHEATPDQHMVRFSLLSRRDPAPPPGPPRSHSPPPASASASASTSPSVSAAARSPRPVRQPGLRPPSAGAAPSTAPLGGGLPPPPHRVSLSLGPLPPAAPPPRPRPRSPYSPDDTPGDRAPLPALDVSLPQALDQLATAHAAGVLSADAYRTLRASAFSRATAVEPAPPPAAPTSMLYTPPPSATHPRPPPLSRSAVHAARLENGSHRTSAGSAYHSIGSPGHAEGGQSFQSGPVKRRSWRKLLPSNSPKRWSSSPPVPSQDTCLSPVPDSSPWDVSTPVASLEPLAEPCSPSLLRRFRPSSRGSSRALSHTQDWGSLPTRGSSSLRTASRASLSSARSSIFSSAGSAPPAPGADWGSTFTMDINQPTASSSTHHYHHHPHNHPHPQRPPSPRSAARAHRLALEKQIAALSAASEALGTHFGSPPAHTVDLPSTIGSASVAANEALGRYDVRIQELRSEVRTATLRERALR